MQHKVTKTQVMYIRVILRFTVKAVSQLLPDDEQCPQAEPVTCGDYAYLDRLKVSITYG